MKPRNEIASAVTPDGGKMVLMKHDRDFHITVNGQELMNSRQYESELELARLGCAHLKKKTSSRVLIGGLGMGYTLREVLSISSPDTAVVVSELLEQVVDWNRDYLSEINGHTLADPRTEVIIGDLISLITKSKNQFDTILLDIDNGPGPVTDQGNHRLYSYHGLHTCRMALRNKGCLAIWSVEPSKEFEQRLLNCGFQVRRYRAPAYKGSKSNNRFIWVASEDLSKLPAGGGEPRKVRQPKELRTPHSQRRWKR